LRKKRQEVRMQWWRCLSCGHEFIIDARAFHCPQCGGISMKQIEKQEEGEP
jgi:predicted RNA-binding Zn-ribbon protein involved in translation (DUF1610 family)